MKRLFAVLLCALMLWGISACDKPSDAPGLEKTIGLGESYLDDGDFEAALEQFLLYIDFEPNDEYGYLCAAEAYIGMGDAKKAMNILEKGHGRTGSDRIQKELDALSPAYGQTAVTEPTVTPSPAVTPEAKDAVALKDGESLYTGHMDCSQAADFQISFILSADLSHIHDIKIVITDLNASFQQGNRTTSVESSLLTETYSGEYPISFEHDNYDIHIGKSTIRALAFEGNAAFIEIDYVYYSSNTGGGMAAIEIPLDTMGGELTTQTAPLLNKAAESAPTALGSSVFPIAYEAYGNPYSITGYTIGKDDSNHTTVTLWGGGYGVLHFGVGGVQIAAVCEFEFEGKTYPYTSASIANDSLKFTFDTSSVPEIITVANGETKKEIVSFLVADVRQR